MEEGCVWEEGTPLLWAAGRLDWEEAPAGPRGRLLAKGAMWLAVGGPSAAWAARGRRVCVRAGPRVRLPADACCVVRCEDVGLAVSPESGCSRAREVGFCLF